METIVGYLIVAAVLGILGLVTGLFLKSNIVLAIVGGAMLLVLGVFLFRVFFDIGYIPTLVLGSAFAGGIKLADDIYGNRSS